MPLVQTRGAASAQGFGEFAQVTAVNYIEDVFSTFLYSGTGASQTITNNIDLSTKGGLVWIKERTSTSNNILTDTLRGVYNYLISNTISEQQNNTDTLTAFNANGFSVGPSGATSESGQTYASWTFRKQAKFFDVLTYTGTGSVQTIAHSLGSVPGCIIVKRTNTTSNWRVYHRSLTSAAYMVELTSAVQAVENGAWNSTAPTSSVFTVGSASEVNASGSTYVAYVFAHDSAGFGLLGTDNVISCGSFTTNGSGVASVNLGYEPQWIVAKAIAGGAGNWFMQDNMRGFTASPTVYTSNPLLKADTADSEATYGGSTLQANATGFTTASATYDPSVTYIYIAIRRGPMKVPTVGTSVYNAIARTGTGATADVTGVGFPVDLNWSHIRNQAYPNVMVDRLRGSSQTLIPSNTDPEQVNSSVTSFASMDGVQYGTSDRTNASGNTYINWYFRRAPNFFDEVCDTGTGVAKTVTHNLGVIPELVIRKSRNNSGTYWLVGSSYLSFANDEYLQLSTTDAVSAGGGSYWNSTAPTSSVFSVGNNLSSNGNGYTFVTYLFATCAGVSKVGSYTGTGALQTVNCGFTSGARFVLIKRSDSTGGWYMYDSVRGITSGDDPYLFANLDAVEVTNTNYVDTDSTGFKVTAAAPAGLNASGGTYIFLAIA